MKIVKFRMFQFTLPLVKTLTVNKNRLTERSGFIIELTDEHGRTGLGEASPLPGLSRESWETAGSQISVVLPELMGVKIPRDFKQLAGLLNDRVGTFNLSSSVRFGLEAAFLNLIAAAFNRPLRKIMSDNATNSLPVNGLLIGDLDEIRDRIVTMVKTGYRTLKLKVGRQSLDDDIRLVHEVRKLSGDRIRLRLDANRAWDIEQAREFFNRIGGGGIEYIEEPVKNLELLLRLISLSDMPVALDESLNELKPDSLMTLPSVKAIIIKPTCLGLEHSFLWAHKALSGGVTPVISSAFESGLGISILAELAAGLDKLEVPVGLDTLYWFERDLLKKPIRIENGRLFLYDSVIKTDNLVFKLMREYPDV